tara:strand:+ start:307 stop:717 length:411 start_codon:yes stop_codon:yes gene_type:complete
MNYSVINASSFRVLSPGAMLPDSVIYQLIEETPWFVKHTIELLFFDGVHLENLSYRQAADAFVINAIIGIQRDMKLDIGGNDWEGVYDCYSMPDEYRKVFDRFIEEGGFSQAYSALKNEAEIPPFQWDSKNRISMN